MLGLMAGLPRLFGTLEAANAGRIGERLLARLYQLDSDQVEVDCSSLTFIDSSGLAVLDHVRNRSGRTIVLQGVRPEVRSVFEATGFDSLFEIP
jgi:anti-anti-sigma factor